MASGLGLLPGGGGSSKALDTSAVRVPPPSVKALQPGHPDLYSGTGGTEQVGAGGGRSVLMLEPLHLGSTDVCVSLIPPFPLPLIPCSINPRAGL